MKIDGMTDDNEKSLTVEADQSERCFRIGRAGLCCTHAGVSDEARDRKSVV